ncbi:MAG: protocatechuate 3,4-dioxygenase [Alphaproteobacteria bacterium]|nr:protocatechuate 3,4-dioxygenase [Alphaproteobacteria bacterium]
MSRRRWLAGAAGMAAWALAPSAGRAAWVLETPSQPAGPYYAPFRPLSIDNDLVFIPGGDGPAKGTLLHLSGRVLDQWGRPIPEARVEIWQANSHGRYNHPRHADSRIPLDPNFQGFGHDATDGDGSYSFRTVKPGPYADNPGWTRPPHIHFAVFPPKGPTWTTQMYFAGEALNDDDFLLNGISDG